MGIPRDMFTFDESITRLCCRWRNALLRWSANSPRSSLAARQVGQTFLLSNLGNTDMCSIADENVSICEILRQFAPEASSGRCQKKKNRLSEWLLVVLRQPESFFLGQHILVPLRLEFHRFADVFVGDFENLILRKPEKYSSWKWSYLNVNLCLCPIQSAIGFCSDEFKNTFREKILSVCLKCANLLLSKQLENW